jgi:hypothetical protein
MQAIDSSKSGPASLRDRDDRVSDCEILYCGAIRARDIMRVFF